MFEIYPTNWPAAVDADRENHFHETALREARVATEASVVGAAAAAAVHQGFLVRIRLALAGSMAPTTESCTCPA
jgi:hypothetical protein